MRYYVNAKNLAKNQYANQRIMLIVAMLNQTIWRAMVINAETKNILYIGPDGNSPEDSLSKFLFKLKDCLRKA